MKQPHHVSRRTALLAGARGLAATLTGSAAWALDRYVIDHVSISDVSAYEAANGSATSAATALASDSQLTITSTSYTSPTSTVTAGWRWRRSSSSPPTSRATPPATSGRCCAPWCAGACGVCRACAACASRRRGQAFAFRSKASASRTRATHSSSMLNP